MEHRAYWALKFLNFDESLVGEKLKMLLLELEEMRLNAYESSKIYKQKMKAYHDRKLMKRNFQPGQQVLLFDSRLKLFPGKLKSKWSGPFAIKDVKPYGAIERMDPSSTDPEWVGLWMAKGWRSTMVAILRDWPPSSTSKTHEDVSRQASDVKEMLIGRQPRISYPTFLFFVFNCVLLCCLLILLCVDRELG